jgi:hypothetical protein
MDDCETSPCTPKLAEQSVRCSAQDRDLESGFQPGASGSFAGRVCTKRSEDEGMNGQVFESDGWGQGPQTPALAPHPHQAANTTGMRGDQKPERVLLSLD